MLRFQSQVLRSFAVGFLAAEAVSASAWWLMLWMFPPTRSFFLPPQVPDFVLMAFFLPDALLFIGAGVIAAFAMWRGNQYAWPLLCIHAAAVVYATLLTVSLAVWGQGGWPGALLMTPCALVVSSLAWWLRPKSNISDT